MKKKIIVSLVVLIACVGIGIIFFLKGQESVNNSIFNNTREISDLNEKAKMKSMRIV